MSKKHRANNSHIPGGGRAGTCSDEVKERLIEALEAIREGRVSNAMSDRLSDTAMARIAHNALASNGVGKVVSPLAIKMLTN